MLSVTKLHITVDLAQVLEYYRILYCFNGIRIKKLTVLHERYSRKTKDVPFVCDLRMRTSRIIKEHKNFIMVHNIRYSSYTYEI